jgi:predicted ATP-grasp superfamily ATP-dependent carboligase
MGYLSPLAPALLCDATWYGTLAAARDLGSRGVPVTLASDALIAPARWSRHVSRTVRCPSTRQPERLLAWLLEFGEREPGHVLYPTSDDLALIIAAHREVLAPRFRLFTPAADVLARLLDKARLPAEARAAGLDVPETRWARDEGDVERAAREMRFPLLLKPRAQVMLTFRGRSRKGMRVDRPADLLPRWREMRRELAFHPMVASRIPEVGLPIIQEAHPVLERIYTVDGFVDETGDLYAALACTKILQRPRRSGPGVCFEEAALAPGIAEALRRLCRATGFRGVFDAEFVIDGERRLLIDLNPRFYNHMAFEVERGLPLPWLAYLAALGEREALRQAVAAAAAPRPWRRAYVHRLYVAQMLAAQAATRAMEPAARRALREWIASHAGYVVDPASAPGDRLPALADVALHLAAFLRHPRAYLRELLAGGEPPVQRDSPAPAPNGIQLPADGRAEGG